MLERTAKFHDRIRGIWERPCVARRLSVVLLVVFLGVGLCVILNFLGLLPPTLAGLLPDNPFYAIRLAFSLILILEVLELIFAIADSVSLAVGKQLEIMALLLLREAFTDISLLNPTGGLDHDGLLLIQVAATAVAGLLLFIFRAMFARLHKSLGCGDIRGYINAKKCVSLALLALFLVAGGHDLYGIFVRGEKTMFFQWFYSALIFTDILMVLVSQYFIPAFQVTFRNSGYAVSTLLMRIAIGSPHHIGAGICVFAGLYLLALTWAVARFVAKEEVC